MQSHTTFHDLKIIQNHTYNKLRTHKIQGHEWHHLLSHAMSLHLHEAIPIPEFLPPKVLTRFTAPKRCCASVKPGKGKPNFRAHASIVPPKATPQVSLITWPMALTGGAWSASVGWRGRHIGKVGPFLRGDLGKDYGVNSHVDVFSVIGNLKWASKKLRMKRSRKEWWDDGMMRWSKYGDRDGDSGRGEDMLLEQESWFRMEWGRTVNIHTVSAQMPRIDRTLYCMYNTQ